MVDCQNKVEIPIVKVHLFKFAVNNSLTKTENEDIAGTKLIKQRNIFQKSETTRRKI